MWVGRTGHRATAWPPESPFCLCLCLCLCLHLACSRLPPATHDIIPVDLCCSLLRFTPPY
ncbi:hypothetical protein M758_10G003500 [Ceratodon purpureus]|uniref:Secreted protein n=1 Tax=Ceratodon purpureus TaxID=3225 RepID=A0A8T0GHL1_CERPU|nr:hypothetical protein KC19_10G003600 [Ceratodon purpureus]KAG0602269.1 hypothetical protein M758_10G003500 [Ceratodon purpureus]